MTTHDGCADEDALTLFVENDNDVYVPNIFSPDGDGVNDELIISTGNGIEKIISFNIYDRWGNVLYEKLNAQPVDIRWDGRSKQKQIIRVCLRIGSLLNQQTTIKRCITVILQ